MNGQEQDIIYFIGDRESSLKALEEYLMRLRPGDRQLLKIAQETRRQGRIEEKQGANDDRPSV